MSNAFNGMEARGFGGADVRGLENLFSHSHVRQESSESHSRRPLSSYSNQSKHSCSTNHDCHQGNIFLRPSSRNNGGSEALLLRYLHPKEMKLNLSDDRPESGHTTGSGAGSGFNRPTRSAGLASKRQMAFQCGIKSLPLDGKRWKTPDTKKSPFSIPSSAKGQIVLQAPDGSNNGRRGLRGSKVRPGASTPRPISNIRQRFESSDSASGCRESSIVLSPSPLSSAPHHSQTSLNGSLEVEESLHGGGSYVWNGSDQGLRLQRHVTSVSSTRTMKRVSEMVHHRIDPMYRISGNKVTLQDRYSVDGIDMQKLQEMTVTREELLSDLRKMKYPYGARVSMTTQQRQRLAQATESKLTGRRHIPAEPSIYPPTPASEPSNAGNNVSPKQIVSDHSEDVHHDIVNDDDDDGDDFNGNTGNGSLL